MGCATREAVSYRVHKSSEDIVGRITRANTLTWRNWRVPLAVSINSQAIDATKCIAKGLFGIVVERSSEGSCRVSEVRAVTLPN